MLDEHSARGTNLTRAASRHVQSWRSGRLHAVRAYVAESQRPGSFWQNALALRRPLQEAPEMLTSAFLRLRNAAQHAAGPCHRQVFFGSR